MNIGILFTKTIKYSFNEITIKDSTKRIDYLHTNYNDLKIE